MKEALTPLSKHKIQFDSEAMHVPVIFHCAENLLPNEETFTQLENLARDERLFSHIAAMSDVHPKKGRKNPTGTVIASQGHIFPQINDTAPNCGMRLIRTELDENNAPPEKIDELFRALVRAVPTKKYFGTQIPFDLALDTCRRGIAPLLQYFQTRTQNEVENSYAAGNAFSDNQDETSRRDILDVIPKLFIRIGSQRLGILGAAGNHFLDLMKITDIIDPVVAAKFQLRPGQYVFLLHTGSGLLGQYASYMYTPKVKEHRSQRWMLKIGTTLFDSQLKKVYHHLSGKIQEFATKEEFFGYEERGMEGRMFIRAHRAAANFGFANRTVITNNIDQTLEKVFGRPIALDMLYDTSHISVSKETHLKEEVWIHRNGAVRARGPKKMADHALFSQTGEPVFIPSSMSTPAYIGVGTDQNNTSFTSAPHGTGRRRQAATDLPKNKAALREKMEKNDVRLYNGQSRGVIQQDSGYYKDVEEVINGLEQNKIIRAVAKMQPVAVLMY